MLYDQLRATFQWVEFRALERLVLPIFKGSTFRGGLGLAYKRVVCALRLKDCPTCLLRYRCAYSVCFETPVPQHAEIMRKYPYAPHPFVLEPPLDHSRVFEEGSLFRVGLWLIGRGIDFLPHFIYAFDEMGRQGIGANRGKIELVRVTSSSSGEERVIYDHKTRELIHLPEPVTKEVVQRRAESLQGVPLRLIFETPMRLKVEGRLASEPDLGPLISALFRRLSALHYFHCDGSDSADFRGLVDKASKTNLRKIDTRWVDWTRYSSRQDVTMQLGGFIGQLECEPISHELLPVLCWGEYLHGGKGSAFGLGKFRIEPIS